MNQVILRDWYCEKCSLQFDKKYVYDLHLTLVHGQEIKVKTESTSEENFEELRQNEKVLSDHITQVADKAFQCDICKSFVDQYLDEPIEEENVSICVDGCIVMFFMVAFQGKVKIKI